MTKDFWRGFTSVISLFPEEDGRDKILPPVRVLSDAEAYQADADAIRSDWEAVGKDMISAAKRFE
jgi:hypothetical protein